MAGGPLERRLAGLEQEERLEDLRAEIAAQLRERLADLRGPEASLHQLRESVLDVDFLRAGPAELAAMRAVVRPLARRLAASARRRRRVHNSGKLDVRKTMRRAIATGGVPIDPAWRRRHRPRPRLVVLCDVSGSVAEFAKFTLSLLHALHAELPRLRSFVFTDGPAEVTDLVESSPGVIDTRLLMSRPGVVSGDGHSDYGAVLRHFLDEHGGELSRDTVIIICGDARANYRPARADLLRTLHGRVRAIHWLNPEPGGGLEHHRFADWAVRPRLRHRDRSPQPPPAQRVGRPPALGTPPSRPFKLPVKRQRRGGSAGSPAGLARWSPDPRPRREW